MAEPEARFFQRHIDALAPNLRCRSANTLPELERLAKMASPHARLIAFCSTVIVPPHILKKLNFNCYNFHPGPPERPGYRPTHFAAHEDAAQYGVTLHKIVEKVDAGEICQVRRFKLNPPMSIEDVETSAYKSLLRLAAETAPMLADIARPLARANEHWVGPHTTKRHFSELAIA